MKTIARSYLESGNLTRGNYGNTPRPVPVTWEDGEWRQDMTVKIADAVANPSAHVWGAWDSDYGWMAPWPSNDVAVAE